MKFAIKVDPLNDYDDFDYTVLTNVLSGDGDDLLIDDENDAAAYGELEIVFDSIPEIEDHDIGVCENMSPYVGTEEITKKILTRLEARGHTLIVPAKEDDEEGVYYIGETDEKAK